MDLAFYDVIEKIELSDTHALQQILTGLTIGIGVEFRDQGHTDHNAIRTDERDQLLQIGKHLLIVLTGIAKVNIRVSVLAVNVEFIDAGCGNLHILPRDIQRSFSTKVPAIAANISKLLQKRSVKQRFAPTEGHTAAGGKKV